MSSGRGEQSGSAPRPSATSRSLGDDSQDDSAVPDSTVWKRDARPTEAWSDGSTQQLFTCDALELLKALADDVADVVFLDPPFNLGKRYGSRPPREDRISFDRYTRFLATVIDHSARVLKPGGALYVYHIPKWAVRLAPVLSRQLTFRHWIAIAMKNGFVRGDNLYPAHYALLYFTKGAPTAFRRPKIPPAKCRHCDGFVKDYGGYRKYIEDGLNLSDFWDDISPVRHRKTKHRDANEIPATIVERVVAISGVEGGLFVDPFMGAGSSLVAATAAGMNVVGSDAEAGQVHIVTRRLREARDSIGYDE